MYGEENVHLLLGLLKRAYQHQIEMRVDELQRPFCTSGHCPFSCNIPYTSHVPLQSKPLVLLALSAPPATSLGSLRPFCAAAGNTVVCKPSEQKLSEDRHPICFGQWCRPSTLDSATRWLPGGLGSNFGLLTRTTKPVLWQYPVKWIFLSLSVLLYTAIAAIGVLT